MVTKLLNDETAVGFVGLGVMGAPMATHLHRAGLQVGLYDLDGAVAKRLAKTLGPRAKTYRSLAQLAAASSIVITMLPNGQVVQDVVLQAGGLLEGLKPGSLLLDTSSSEPWLTRATAARLKTHKVAMVDAPVSGAAWGAQEANLVFMVGGGKADLKRVQPLLNLMGRAVFHLGPLGSGDAMKSINTLITAVTFAAAAEGLVIGQSQGLDVAAIVDVLNESTGMSWITHNHIRQRIVSRSFDDTFKLDLMLKDVGTANTLARENANTVPLSVLTHQLYQAAARLVDKDASVSELVRRVEAQSGVEIAGGNSPQDRKTILNSLPR